MRRTQDTSSSLLISSDEDDNVLYKESPGIRKSIPACRHTDSSDEEDNSINRKSHRKTKTNFLSQGANVQIKKTKISSTKQSLSQGASTSRNSSLSQNSQRSPDEEFRNSGSQKSQAKIFGIEEEMQLAAKVIKYLLLVDRKKQPIQKSRIVKHLFNGSTRNYNQVIKRVKDTLYEVFGYNLVLLDGNKYILTNKIQNNLPHLTFSKSERVHLVLLFIVLAHIFMSGDSCKEGSLWQFLENLGILGTNDSDVHPYFGDVKQLIISEFIGQQYIERVVADNTDPPLYEFKWGARAENELSRRDVLQFISQVYNGRPIKSWPIQYQIMIATEQLNEQ